MRVQDFKIISQKLGYLKAEGFNKVLDILREIQRMLNGLINSLRVKTRAQ